MTQDGPPAAEHGPTEHHRMPHLSEHIPGHQWPIEKLPGWLRKTAAENRWPVTIGVLAAVVLQIVLPDNYGLSPRYLLPGLEGVLLVVLVVANPVRLQREHRFIRWASLGLTLVLGFANFTSIVRLINQILHHTTPPGGVPPDYVIKLLGSGVAIWFTNIIVYALWYWEFDRGGPFARADGARPYPDFLFPQMSDPSKARPDWNATFVDYAYLSFTNSTSFSPTDTMPMTSWAKLAMASQSLVSLATIGLVVARAVGILP